MPEYALRAIGADEVRAFLRAATEGFNDDPNDEEERMFSARLQPERTLAAFAGDEIVATSALADYELTVPGAVVPMAGVTAVAVDPVHRRRGLLTRMMRGLLEAVHERGDEALSGLWASEAPLYGRFGYGLAAPTGGIRVRTAEAELLVPVPGTRPRRAEPTAAIADMAAVYDAVRPGRPGMLSRDPVDWEHAVWDPESRRAGAKRLRAVVQPGADGTPAGYALYTFHEHGGSDEHAGDDLELRELLATTPEAAAALWDHLLRMSLTDRVRWDNAPVDEPLFHMLTDARATGLRVYDGFFVRLVDVARALAERRYTVAVDVVLEVADPLCAWNEGRWRLAGDASGATCEATDAPADLTLSAADLGTVHLGGPTLAVLGAAGRVHEHTAGALEAASVAFQGVRAPWCPEDF